MRAAGHLLTLLALLAVQAPWIACTCDEAAACVPLLTGGRLDEHHHVAGAHEGCCDVLAHAVHGGDHAHGTACDHEAHHDHAPAPRRPHEGWRVPCAPLPPAVALQALQGAPAWALLPPAADACLVRRRGHVRSDPEPPERACVPAASAERLLL